MLTYSCPPSAYTPAQSTMAKAYFQRLRDSACEYEGTIRFPDPMVGWRGTDGKAESLILTTTKVQMKLANF